MTEAQIAFDGGIAIGVFLGICCTVVFYGIRKQADVSTTLIEKFKAWSIKRDAEAYEKWRNDELRKPLP